MMKVAIYPFFIYFQQRLNPKAMAIFSLLSIPRPGGHVPSTIAKINQNKECYWAQVFHKKIRDQSQASGTNF